MFSISEYFLVNKVFRFFWISITFPVFGHCRHSPLICILARGESSVNCPRGNIRQKCPMFKSTLAHNSGVGLYDREANGTQIRLIIKEILVSSGPENKVYDDSSCRTYHWLARRYAYHISSTERCQKSHLRFRPSITYFVLYPRLYTVTNLTH